MFPLYMYVCMQSTWCMNVIHHWRKKRRESRAGSDVISVTRLRDWRDGELKGHLPSRPFGWVATFRKRREKIRVFIIFIIGEHKHLRHSTQWREKGRIVEQDRLQDEGRKNKKTFRGKEIGGRFLFFLRDPTGKDLFSDWPTSSWPTFSRIFLA